MRCESLASDLSIWERAGNAVASHDLSAWVRAGNAVACSRKHLLFANLPQPGPRQNCKCSPLLSDWHPRAVSTVDGADPRPSAERATTKKALQPLSQRLLSIE